MPTRSTRRRTEVSIQVAVPRRGVPGAAALRRWARGFPATTLRIVGEREGRRLNRKFRGKDKATNVLAFPYGAGQGEIVLCHPVIAREALRQGKTLRAHYAHLVVHGLLHLRGHDHRRRRQAARMERKEILVLRRLGFADPYKVK